MESFNIKTLLISHFYNEEDLLPQWLNHHKDLFDHGVLINYRSTDSSVKIINTICPTWEIVSPTEDFGPCVNDIHDIESRFDCWKIALNITEFLLTDNYNLKKTIHDFQINYPGWHGMRLRSCILVDKDKNEEYNPDIPILKQKCHGYFEEDVENLIDNNVNYTGEARIYKEEDIIPATAINTKIGIDGRFRLLHKAQTGNYTQGRHATTNHGIYPRSSGFCREPDLIVCWLGYSPFSIYKKRINNCSRQRYGCLNPEVILHYQQEISYNLFKDERYKDSYDKLYN